MQTINFKGALISVLLDTLCPMVGACGGNKMRISTLRRFLKVTVSLAVLSTTESCRCHLVTLLDVLFISIKYDWQTEEQVAAWKPAETCLATQHHNMFNF
jgi:hypothetical protein